MKIYGTAMGVLLKLGKPEPHYLPRSLRDYQQCLSNRVTYKVRYGVESALFIHETRCELD